MNQKRVLITGGNKGIGLELSKLFLELKYEVIVVARDFTKFNLQKEKNIRTIKFDLRQIDEIPKLVKTIGVVDVLINNAGVMKTIPYDLYTDKEIEDSIKINLKAPIKLITEFSRKMIKNKRGRIVNNASIAGEIGHPDIWYGMTKAGIINATKSFAKILGSDNIIVNAVAPGPVETEMLKVIPKERKVAIKKQVFTNRFAKAVEVAKTILWLSTESPEYINGICIDINNGAFLR